MSNDVLVSTALLKRRREEARAELEGLRPYLSEQVLNMAERVLLTWEKAEREAALEFVPTAKAARLTGWSADTLTTYAGKIERTEEVPEAWAGLIAQRNAAGWAFALASIPPKQTGKAAA